MCSSCGDPPLALADGFLHDGLASRGDYREFSRGSIARPARVAPPASRRGPHCEPFPQAGAGRPAASAAAGGCRSQLPPHRPRASPDQPTAAMRLPRRPLRQLTRRPLVPRLVPGRPAARRLAVHHQMTRAVLPLRRRWRAFTRHPAHDDPPRSPLVPVLAALRVAPPVRTMHPDDTIRTRVRPAATTCIGRLSARGAVGPAQAAGKLVNDATIAGRAGQAGLGHLRGVIRRGRDHVAQRAQLRVDPLP
jgi:hypothetical protein